MFGRGALFRILILLGWLLAYWGLSGRASAGEPLAATVSTPSASGIAHVERIDTEVATVVGASRVSAEQIDAGGNNGRWRLNSVDGSGRWTIQPTPMPSAGGQAAGPGAERLLVLYHPYSARATLSAPGMPAVTRSLFDRDLDPRFSRHGLVFPLHGDAALTLSVEGARYPLQIEIVDANDYLLGDRVHLQVMAIVLGMLIGISLVVLVFWLRLHERIYLFYAGAMIMQLLYLLCAYGEAYAMPGVRLLGLAGAPGIWTVATLATVVTTLFLLELGDLDRDAPRLGQFLRWAGVILPSLLLIGLWLPLPIEKGWFPSAGNLLLLAANALALLALGQAWLRGNRRAGYALLAWVPLVSVSTLRTVQMSLGTTLGPGLEYGMPLALAGAAVLLVLVLADRTLVVRRERDDAQAQSERDSLTGVLNRSGIERHLADALSASEGAGGTLAVLFLDLDHFKRINDVHGHAIGDACLRAMVHASLDELGPDDLFGRYGGEEFLAIMPGRGSSAARDVAERIRQAVQTSCAVVDGAAVELTLSIGIAFGHPGDTLDTLLRRADEALYAAKRGNRNRVEVAAIMEIA